MSRLGGGLRGGVRGRGQEEGVKRGGRGAHFMAQIVGKHAHG